jgi:hypothetical protein
VGVLKILFVSNSNVDECVKTFIKRMNSIHILVEVRLGNYLGLGGD